MRALICLFLVAHAVQSLLISQCNQNASSQMWTLTSLGSPSTVISSSSGLCLATLSCTPAKGDGVRLAPCATPICTDHSDILWTLDKNGLLTSAASNGALTLTLANVVGPEVNLWFAKGAEVNGEWIFNGLAGSSGGTLTTAAAGHECLTANSSPGTIAIINASVRGLPLYGIGGLAAIGGARLIYEYPPSQKRDILDLLFNSSGGTAFQVLKTEIEGDMDSSYGSGSSYWHDRSEAPDFTRGIYLPWLLKEARARNPSIGTYALAWGMPGFITPDTPSGDAFLGADALNYRMRYFEGVRTAYNLSFDLVGVHNERSWSREFVKELRAALDSAGFNSTRISVGDGGNNECEDCPGSDNTITTALATDSLFANALGVIGLHSAGENGLAPLPNSYDWERNGKTYIQSESNTVDGTYVTLNGSFPQWDSNAGSTYGPGLSWPRQFILSYVHGRGTGTIICPLSHAWTWLYGRHNHGTAEFIRPWDGSYILGSAFWGQAHFTQATRAGWYFLDGSASGTWDTSGGTDTVVFATLVAPDLSAFSVVAVNVDANFTAPLAFRLVGTLAESFASTMLSVWTSNVTALFSQCHDIAINADGSFSFDLPPRTALTLTTLRTLSKFEPIVPSRAPFPLPFTSSFATQTVNEPGRLLSDLYGAFEISPDPLGVRGNVLRQSAPISPHSWLSSSGDGIPFTSLPAPGTAFANGRFSVDTLVMAGDAVTNGAFVSVCGRVPIWQPADFHVTTAFLGVCLGLNVTSGSWTLTETTLAAGKSTQLAYGSLGTTATGVWHTLTLSFIDDTATAVIDGNLVASVTEGTLHTATGGFGFGSAWHRAYFDRVSLDSSVGHAVTPKSWLFDVLPGEILVNNFTGWAGFVLDLRLPTTTPLNVAALGRFRARGNLHPHKLDILDAATGLSVLTEPVTVDFETCVTDLLGFCYTSLPSPVALSAGKRFYIVSYETAGEDAFVAMTDAAAATTHVHRDGSTLMSYAGPGQGIVAGKVSQADGAANWIETMDVECMYGPLNLLIV